MRARPCCWRATPCTATSRPTRPAAACSAGCWRCSARTSVSPCRSGGAQQLAPCAAAAGRRRRRRGPHRRPRGLGRPVRVAAPSASGCEDGTTVTARKAVLADVPAPRCTTSSSGTTTCRPAFVRDLAKFQWDYSTIKVNWALDRPVPWRADGGSGRRHRPPRRGLRRPRRLRRRPDGRAACRSGRSSSSAR